MYKFGELWNGLRSMLRLYEKMMKNVCRKYGLSMVEVDIIAFLKNHPMKDTAASNYCVREVFIMERIKTIATRDLTKSVQTGGCGECQTSCQSACKTSCGVANQQCENSNK